MRSFRYLPFVTACLFAAGTFAPASRANIYNAVTDFSVASNPNGVWSYQMAGALFPLSDSFTGTCGVPASSCISWNNQLFIPDNHRIVKNLTGSVVLESNGTVFLDPNYLNLDPEDASVAVVFTAPSTGFYQVAGQFLGIDAVGNAHPVSVIENGSVSLFASSIATFHQGAPFDLNLNLNAGDTIAFNVGTGSSGCSYCFLSTGLWTEITNSTSPITIPAPLPVSNPIPTPTPEPRTLPLLVLSLTGLVAVRLRRRQV